MVTKRLALPPGKAPGPDGDTIEVNLFGPGAGESVLVHLGSDAWLLVDSCSAVRGGTPAALEYLHSIGRDPSACVRYIVATHWHDDHVHGLSQAVAACPNADVWVTNALDVDSLSAMFLRSPDLQREGTHEFAGVMREMQGKGTRRRPERHLNTATEHVRIDATAQHHPAQDIKITVLAPTFADIEYSAREIKKLLASADGPSPGGVRAPNKNHSSVVLHVQAGAQVMLLCGDREISAHEGRGWHAVLRNHERKSLPQATVVKVAHHGSPNGDDPRMWSEMLANPVAVVAPFFKGVHGGRPRSDDARRILASTPHAFITSTPRAPLPPFASVGGTFAQANVGVRPNVAYAEPRMGHVRLAAPRGGGRWVAVYGRPAGHISSLL